MALEIGSARNKEDLYTVRYKACLNSYIKLSLRFWSLYQYLDHLITYGMLTLLIKIDNSIYTKAVFSTKKHFFKFVNLYVYIYTYLFYLNTCA